MLKSPFPLKKGSKKLINAWAFYDWANSVYPLVISSTIFPIYYGTLFDDINTISFFDKEKWIISDYREKNKKDLRANLQKIFKLKTAEYLEILLNEYGVPAGKIRTLPEALNEDQFKLRGLWNPIHIKSIGKNYKVPSVGFKVNCNSIKADEAPPTLGENSKLILKDLGFTSQEIKSLFKEQIIK